MKKKKIAEGKKKCLQETTSRIQEMEGKIMIIAWGECHAIKGKKSF